MTGQGIHHPLHTQPYSPRVIIAQYLHRQDVTHACRSGARRAILLFAASATFPQLIDSPVSRKKGVCVACI